jgi:AbrB family looped-hinge helix DNA binding protein
MTRIVRPLRSGQITIPAEFRKQLGITEDSVLELTLQGAELRIKALRPKETAEGSPWFKDLYEHFAPVREEAEQYSEEEIETAIDEAVRAARRENA